MAATGSSLANRIMTLAVPSEYSNVTSSTTYKMKKEVIFLQNDDNCHAPPIIGTGCTSHCTVLSHRRDGRNRMGLQ